MKQYVGKARYGNEKPTHLRAQQRRLQEILMGKLPPRISNSSEFNELETVDNLSHCKKEYVRTLAKLKSRIKEALAGSNPMVAHQCVIDNTHVILTY